MSNLLIELTNMRIRTFYWVSQIGMLIATTVYVNAGTQLSNLVPIDHPLDQSFSFSLNSSMIPVKICSVCIY